MVALDLIYLFGEGGNPELQNIQIKSTSSYQYILMSTGVKCWLKNSPSGNEV
jgi:hypothetical protein